MTGTLICFRLFTSEKSGLRSGLIVFRRTIYLILKDLFIIQMDK